MATLEDLKIRIVSVLGSEKDGCTESDLYRKYKDLYGKDLRPKEYGFKDIKMLLNSSVMQGQGGVICKNGRYFAAGDENTTKMLELVRNTKSRKKTRRMKGPTSIRGGSRSSGIAPSRPSSSAAVCKKTPPVNVRKPVVAAKQQRPISQIPAMPPTASQTNFKALDAGTATMQPSFINNSNLAEFNMPSERFGPIASSEAFSNELTKLLKSSQRFSNPPARFMEALQTRDNQTSIPSSFKQFSSGSYPVKLTAFKGEPTGVIKAFDNQFIGPVASSQTRSNYPFRSTQQGLIYDDRSIPHSSISEIQRRPPPNKTVEKDGMMKSQKGKRRLERLIEQYGGEVVFSKLERAYERQFQTPFDKNEICRLFGVTEEEIQDRYEFLKSHLCSDIRVTKQADGDILLTVDDEDDIDGDFENLSVIDNSSRRISPILIENRSMFSRGAALPSTVRSQDDFLSYKQLGDRMLSFVQTSGPVKIHNLSKIFYEQDGRYVDPKNYPEGTWENIIRRILSRGGHPELVFQDGMIGLRGQIQKSTVPLPSMANYSSNGSQNGSERPALNSIDSTVPAAVIYDLLEEAGRPLPQKEILEKLSAKGIKVNACQLTVKLIMKFKDVFRCEFGLAGALISLEKGAQRPIELATTSCDTSLPEKTVRITTHVMSDYRSTIESADSLFKPIVLINVELVDEVPNELRIRASFRLRSLEPAYKLFEEDLYQHYRSYGQDVGYAVDRVVAGGNYVFCDASNEKVYRVRCLNDGDSNAIVPVFLIDQLRYEKASVSRLKKLINGYARPAFGVVAQTAPFVIVPGKEGFFREYFSQIRSKLLRDTHEEIKAYVDSEPSEKLFELNQLFTEAHDYLKVPATLLRQNLIKMHSSQPPRNGSQNSLRDLPSIARGPPGIVSDVLLQPAINGNL